MPSPGIAQLLELDSPGYDDDMSFSALMRLRGRAFGGSSSSVNSAGREHSVSSPLAHVSHHQMSHSEYNSARMSGSIHGQSSSTVGIPESEEEDDDGDRPTLTQNTPRKKTTGVGTYTSQEDLPVSPAAGHERRKGTTAGPAVERTVLVISEMWMEDGSLKEDARTKKEETRLLTVNI